MSSENDRHPGIPTRVIHEAYVELMQAMSSYYRADQQGSENQLEQAHTNLQHRVLAFFEVLRPYLKSKNSVEDYWVGQSPNYDDDDGTAVLASQTHQVPVNLEFLQEASGDRDWTEMPMEWLDEQLTDHYTQINGNAKIESMYRDEDSGTLLLQVNQYQTGLQQLDGQFNMSQQQVDRGSSYMRHKTQSDTIKRKMPVEKLFAAAHALEEAADRLNLLTYIKEERQKYLAGGEDNEYPEPYEDAEPPN